ncbi:MAG: SpoIIE family protein phosphatase [Candidatus Eremiobacteraeota bacterium]|nr:SpoIIE family protein phosphatase [Candidatus Eremiobacteraeota bacterium]
MYSVLVAPVSHRLAPSHIPANDVERLSVVRRYDILDTPQDGSFDRITKLAAAIFDVPIALVTVVDEDRIWFKSRHGLDAVSEISRDPGLCASAICQDMPYIVEDARNDPRSLANPLVAGEFGLQFYAAAPLQTRDGFNLGTLCVIDRDPRSFGAREQEILQTLAGVVVDELELRLSSLKALAVERDLRAASKLVAEQHEKLYEREHLVARTFQQAMLPQSFPDLAGLHFDARYAPAANESELGGDWFDAFAVDDDRVLVSIGDVAGHGLQAAVLMGKMRQSMRALALGGAPPREILHSLDRVLESEAEDSMVTAFVGVIDCVRLTLTFANAGHPPPYLLDPKGEVKALEAGGLPLGMRAKTDPDATVVSVEPGSLLVLYTDGLVEAERDLIAGMNQLRAVISDPAVRASTTPAGAIQDAMRATEAPDDVAVLTVGFEKRREAQNGSSN